MIVSLSSTLKRLSNMETQTIAKLVVLGSLSYFVSLAHAEVSSTEFDVNELAQSLIHNYENKYPNTQCTQQSNSVTCSYNSIDYLPHPVAFQAPYRYEAFFDLEKMQMTTTCLSQSSPNESFASQIYSKALTLFSNQPQIQNHADSKVIFEVAQKMDVKALPEQERDANLSFAGNNYNLTCKQQKSGGFDVFTCQSKEGLSIHKLENYPKSPEIEKQIILEIKKHGKTLAQYHEKALFNISHSIEGFLGGNSFSYKESNKDLKADIFRNLVPSLRHFLSKR
jgi:hypothetical protein